MQVPQRGNVGGGFSDFGRLEHPEGSTPDIPQSGAEWSLARSELTDPIENHERLERRWDRSRVVTIATTLVAATVAVLGSGDVRLAGICFAVIFPLFGAVDQHRRRAHRLAATRLRRELASLEEKRNEGTSGQA